MTDTSAVGTASKTRSMFISDICFDKNNKLGRRHFVVD